MLHKKRITFTVIRFFVLHPQFRSAAQNTASGSGGGKNSMTHSVGNFIEFFLKL